jgi:phosphoribosylanthranilate isomerase
MSYKLQIKVCGLKNSDEINKIDELQLTNYLGLIFYEKSPRNFQGDSPKLNNSKKVGVFVNENRLVIFEKARKYHLDFVQLHGNESPEFCHLVNEKIPVIKVFHLKENFPFSVLNKYVGHAKYFLFDTPSPEKGGTGRKFDWTLLNKYNGETPFFLSGGLGPNDIDIIEQINHPKLIGLDLNSRFEIKPGSKNIDLLKIFINGINN